MKNPGKYASASAFSPICNPTAVPWGKKAFEGYLGSVEAGKAHDAVELINAYSGAPFPLLVDQGTADNFLTGDVNQLQPTKLAEACAAKGIDLNLRMQEGAPSASLPPRPRAPTPAPRPAPPAPACLMGSARVRLRPLVLLHLQLHRGPRQLPR